MSYIELGSVAFRGELRGATGYLRGTLTADAVNAVDTINIATGQITYNTVVSYNNLAVVNNGTMLVANIVLPDASCFIEVQAYCHGGEMVVVDGGERNPTSTGHVATELVPFSELILLPGGSHQIYVRSGFTGISAFGYIHVQYIRNTGA